MRKSPVQVWADSHSYGDGAVQMPIFQAEACGLSQKVGLHDP